MDQDGTRAFQRAVALVALLNLGYFGVEFGFLLALRWSAGTAASGSPPQESLAAPRQRFRRNPPPRFSKVA